MSKETLIEDIKAMHAHLGPKWNKFSAEISDAFGNEKEFTDLEVWPEIRFDVLDQWFGDAEKEKQLNSEFLGFAQMGEGSMVANWLLEGTDMETSPVVLIGSEGEVGVIAPNYLSFMMLTGQGFGMYDLLEAKGVPNCDACEPFMQFMQRELQIEPILQVKPAVLKAKKDNPDLEGYLF